MKMQLNVASFTDMRDSLVESCIKYGLTREKEIVENTCGIYFGMRDGCEINGETFNYAISELRNKLNL